MRRILSLLTLATASVFFAIGAKAAGITTVSLAWNPSPSQDIAGYEIYYGTSSGNYTAAVPAPNTATNVTIRGLATGTTYYFAATSYDSFGNESDYSPEVSSVAGGTGQLGLIVTSLSGSQYVVQDSADMVNWETLKIDMQSNGPPYNFVEYLNNGSIRVNVSVTPAPPHAQHPPVR